MPSGKLLAHTLELVRNRPRAVTYELMQKKTRIPVSWMQALMTGKIKEPSVNRIEKLYVYFTGSQLPLI